jgi:CRP-like cAMP-binding protein
VATLDTATISPVDRHRESRSGGLDRCLHRIAGEHTLPREAIGELVRRARTIFLPRGATLFERGGEGPGLCVVDRGQLKIGLLSARGREQILYLAGPDRLITEGYHPLGGRCAAHATARVDARLWIVSRRAVQAACEQCPSLAAALLHVLATRCSRYIERIFWLSLLPVEGRLAAFLLSSVRNARPRDGDVVPRSLDVETVAALIGSTREEVTRVQMRLHRAGILRVERRFIHILDADALASLAG